MDHEKAARAIDEFLRALGHEPEGALADTPRLVAQAWCDELLDGEGIDPTQVLRDGAVPCDPAATGLVVLRELHVSSMCPHHLLPSHGTATVVYQPGERVAGFGAIARALRACTRRLTLQEEATATLAAALMEGLGARGALCAMTLSHSCLIARGARETTARVESLQLAGSFATEPDRSLALAAWRGPA